MFLMIMGCVIDNLEEILKEKDADKKDEIAAYGLDYVKKIIDNHK